MSDGWHTGFMAAFDLETTAQDPTEARIVTASIAYLGSVDGKSPRPREEWLVDPGIPIPEGATAVHGITTEHAQANGGRPVIAVPQIAASIREVWATGWPVVAFNASYDLTVLDRELRRLGFDGLTIGRPAIDPFAIDRHVDKYRKGSRTLTAQAAHYRVALDGAHNAAADAIAAARVAWRIATLYPEIARMPLGDLHAAQVGWHAERQADFAAYLRRVGKPSDDANGDWPLRSGAPV